MKRIRLATVFSGIGSIEFALRRLGIDHEIVFACDNGERDIEYDKDKEFKYIKSLPSFKEKQKYVKDLYDRKTRKHNFVKDSYLANYTLEESKFYEDICLLDGTEFNRKIDLFVGGSPCQSFSQVGYQKGLEDARGTLFYEYARLIKEIEPKVFIYENVRNIIKHDKGNTWRIIKQIFDTLGYDIDFKILNAVNFNIPQKRNRLFVVGIRKDLNKQISLIEKKDELKFKLQDFLVSNCRYGNFICDNTGKILIKKEKGIIEDRYFLSKAVKDYVLKDGTKNWKQKVEIDLPIARTLLKTMGNCHRAGVDNYITEDGKLRMLTDREAHRLMGFTDDYKIVVSIAQAYKQAGNSIVVDVMMEIIKTIINTGVWEDEIC